MELDERDGISPPWVDGQPVLSDADGSVWVCTSTGISNYSPSADFAIRFPAPQVFVSGSSLELNVLIPADAIRCITPPPTAGDRFEIVVLGEDMPQSLGRLMLMLFPSLRPGLSIKI
jgi:hypothetical protein